AFTFFYPLNRVNLTDRKSTPPPHYQTVALMTAIRKHAQKPAQWKIRVQLGSCGSSSGSSSFATCPHRSFLSEARSETIV
ncbi:MAG: hypothetical protein ACHBNF_05680, partial [Chromatiales bacterium]